jgi:hypothetical protein
MSVTASPVGITTSGSTQIDAVSVNNGNTTVDRQVVSVGDPATWGNQLAIDGSGRVGAVVVGPAASGSATSGNPVLAAGTDGTNARTLLTSSSGVLDVQLTGATGTAMLPAATAAADSMSNPTATQVNVLMSAFNGSTWDRFRGNVNTLTGDSGTKTSSFNGNTQTNYNHRGAKITVVCGTVSGTSPTLTARIQWSPDGGTTWINYGPASGTATATGNTITIDIYPTTFSSGSGSTSALTTGATQTLFISGVLPRTWRISYTIGGTSPSFAINGTYVNYVL